MKGTARVQDTVARMVCVLTWTVMNRYNPMQYETTKPKLSLKAIVIVALVLLSVAVALGTFKTFIYRNTGEIFTAMIITQLMTLAMLLRSNK